MHQRSPLVGCTSTPFCQQAVRRHVEDGHSEDGASSSWLAFRSALFRFPMTLPFKSLHMKQVLCDHHLIVKPTGFCCHTHQAIVMHHGSSKSSNDYNLQHVAQVNVLMFCSFAGCQ